MSLEFVIGLLLALATLGALAYIVKEFLSTTSIDFKKVSVSDGLGVQRTMEPVPINEHLIGMVGEIVREVEDDERPLRVRLGSELWPARPEQHRDAPAADFALGASVRVIAVQGPVAVVGPVEREEQE